MGKKEVWKEIENLYDNIFSDLKHGRYILNHQPGAGKTFSLAIKLKDSEKRIAFFTSTHSHIEKFKGSLKNLGVKEDEYIYGMGFARGCRRYPKTENIDNWSDDEIFIDKIYKGFGKKSAFKFICSSCNEKKRCGYYEYRKNMEIYRITLQPLESLFFKDNDSKDLFVIDEVVGKKEMRYWDFDYKKLNEYIKIHEDKLRRRCGLKSYKEDLLEFHRFLLKKTSVIFNEPPNILFSILDSSESEPFKQGNYKKRNFLQKDNYVTHPQVLSGFDCYKESFYNGLKELLLYNIYKDSDDYVGSPYVKEDMRAIDEYIKKGIRDKKDYIYDVIENNLPLYDWSKFYEMFLMKLGNKVGELIDDLCLIVCEKLEHTNSEELKDEKKEIVKETDEYEKGFIEDCPYILQKKTNRYIVSRMGKSYENLKKPKNNKDTWFQIGHPYLYRIFDIAMKKPVILLDATFNEEIYEKLRIPWTLYYMSHDALKNYRSYRLPKNGDIPLFRRNPIGYRQIKNMNSTVYDVNGPFPKKSLESNNKSLLRKVERCIENILEKKPENTLAIIPHEAFEEEIKGKFPKAIVAHHFNTRGKDMDAKLLFVIGTPYHSSISDIYDYILTFNEFPKSTERINIKGRFDRYEDDLLNELLKVNVIDELYHELHRSRMLQNDRIVYAFCRIPDKIFDEVKVKDIQHIEALSGDPKMRLLEIIIENEGISKTEINNKTKNRLVFKFSDSNKILLEKLEKANRIRSEKESGRTKKTKIFYSTGEGKKAYGKYIEYSSKFK